MTRTKWLGALFLAPAVIFVVLFFLAPVVLTGVFAFTNMSTATGIGGGFHLVTPSILRELAAEGMDREAVETLSRATFRVDSRSLARARRAGQDPAFLAELERRHGGQSFNGRRAFERALKRLSARPRSVRARRRTR